MELTTLSQPSLKTQLRALLVIARKDWKVFWRYPLNAVSNIFQPIIWITPVYFMGKAFSTNGEALGFAAYTGSGDYMSYILLGTVLTNFILTVFWGMGYALKNDMDSGVLESNWLAPISRLLILVGRTLTSMLTTMITSIVMLLIAGMLFGFKPTGSTVAAILTAIPMLVGLYGFGFAFAGVVLLMREANTLVDVGSFLIQGFSGTNFPVKSLPYWLIPISLMLPLTYGLDAVRGFLLKTNTLLPINVEIVILIVFMFVMLWIGAQVFYRIERRVRTLGTLGQH
ncbi:MAG: ABC transporter permease [Anaerolineales bacterium]|nr:ABC transporter permease [Anaerolineales bacterium]NUQ84837.1 ABC transporter permease [Anaerolineales bacterium]